MNRESLIINEGRIAEVCNKYHVRRLALFGSVLREDFDKNSDIDMLIEFDQSHVPGYFGLARVEREISDVLEGRKVDLRTPLELSTYFREKVLSSARELYADR